MTISHKRRMRRNKNVSLCSLNEFRGELYVTRTSMEHDPVDSGALMNTSLAAT